MSDHSEDKTANEESQMRLVDVPVENEPIALNLIVSFLNVAQRRGAFTMDESAKIWECVKMFQQAPGGVESDTGSASSDAQ